MPAEMLKGLPAKAKEIWEAAFDEAKKEHSEERAAKMAWGAVKNAGYRKGKSGSWVKMSDPVGLIFGEEPVDGEWVEVACTGDFVDMNGNSVSITREDFEAWIGGYNENARGQELPITYDHPKSGGIAAGWFRGLKVGPTRKIRGQARDVLLMKPEWTEGGRESIQNKDYQYLSLEIMPDNNLRGASLVNFPAVKGLDPVTKSKRFHEYLLMEFMMAEDKENPTKCPECGGPVPEGSKACPSCGAKMEQEEETQMSEENTGVELSEVQAALTELKEERDGFVAKLEELAVSVDQERKLREQAEKEKNALSEEVQKLVGLNNMLRLTEKVTDFTQLSEDPSKAISPAYVEKIVEVMLAAPDKEEEILELLGAFAKGDAIVPLGEVGTGRTPAPLREGSDPTNLAMHEAAKKLMENKGISYREALIEASREGN